MAMKIVAGASSADAVSPWPRGLSTTRLMPRRLRLELLVPPVLERRIVLGDVTVVEVDQALLLFRREADALLHVGRHLGVGDGGVVAHVDGEAFLGRSRHHGVE